MPLMKGLHAFHDHTFRGLIRAFDVTHVHQ